MKKYLLIALASVSFLSFSHNTFAQEIDEEIALENAQENPDDYITPEPDDYTEDLKALIEIQSIQNYISAFSGMQNEYELKKIQKQLSDEHFKKIETCNIEKLKEVYKSPEDAWKNITKEYENRELNLSVDILNADPKQQPTGDELSSEVTAYWQIGKDLLTDVYAHPEKYGEVKDGASFPLWKDQKYIYDNGVNAFLTTLNKQLNRKGAIPGVSSENTYAQNEKAYTEFLNSLSESEKEKIQPELQKFPIPPNALPPVREIIQFHTDPSQTKRVFPSWPEPWKEFIKNGYAIYNETGEMAEFFHPKTTILKDEIKQQANGYMDNRLNVYIGAKKIKNVTDREFQIVTESQNEFSKDISNKLNALLITDSVDFSNPESVKNAKEKLKEQKSKYIATIREKIQLQNKKSPSNLKETNKDFLMLPYNKQLEKLETLEKGSPEYVEAIHAIRASQTHYDLKFVDAVEKDMDGELLLTPLNAENAEHLANEKAAEKALIEEVQKKQISTLKKGLSPKINSSCLLGDQ